MEDTLEERDYEREKIETFLATQFKHKHFMDVLYEELLSVFGQKAEVEKLKLNQISEIFLEMPELLEAIVNEANERKENKERVTWANGGLLDRVDQNLSLDVRVVELQGFSMVDEVKSGNLKVLVGIGFLDMRGWTKPNWRVERKDSIVKIMEVSCRI
jgi:hypothetical protein